MKKLKRFSLKSRYAKDLITSSPLPNYPRPTTTLSPTSTKSLMKRLINQKIPTPKSIREFYSGFSINNCKLQSQTKKDVKSRSKLNISEEISDPEYEAQYQQFVSLALKDIEYNDTFKTIDKELTCTSCKPINRLSTTLSKQRCRSFNQPYGRFHKKSSNHSKSLLPQTKAKLRRSRPAISPKLTIDGQQTPSLYKEKPKHHYVY